MKISFLTIRHIKVNDIIHLININTSSHKVCGNEEAEITLSELLICFLSEFLMFSRLSITTVKWSNTLLTTFFEFIN